MTDRPINLSDWQVRAALDGRLSLVVEPVIPPSPYDPGDDFDAVLAMGFVKISRATGDRMWVRETWRVGAWNHCDGGIAVDYLADNFARKEWLYHPDFHDRTHSRLINQSRADAEAAGALASEGYWEYRWSPGQSPCRIRPSTHMPRWASRLTLIVTDVRVMRVQEVNHEDAVDAACKHFWDEENPVEVPCPNGKSMMMHQLRDATEDLKRKWNARHAKHGLGWDANPWVTTTTVTVHRCNIDQMEGQDG